MVSEEELRRQAEEIDMDLERESANQPPKRFFTPLRIVLSLFLALIIVLMVVPYYGVRIDPNPKDIPQPSEVVPTNLTLPDGNYDRNPSNFRLLIKTTPEIKLIADRIVSRSCQSSKVCDAKALFLFVRDNLNYVSDPPDEYVKQPVETLLTFSGDCDDASVLLASLLTAVGIPVEFRFVPQHVYLQAYLPESPKHYQSEGGWVNLDPTCKNCGFGELPVKYSS